MHLNNPRYIGSFVAFVAALALLGAGCGGSSDSTNDSGNAGTSSESAKELTTVTVSKKVYMKKADLICRDVPKHYFQTQEALKKELKGKKLTKSEETLKIAVPPLRRASRELKELGLPKGDEVKATEFIEAMEAGIKGLEDKPLSKLSGPKSPFDKFQKLTIAYGLKFCPSL